MKRPCHTDNKTGNGRKKERAEKAERGEGGKYFGPFVLSLFANHLGAVDCLD